jgi:cobaltochelatase CobN
MNFKKTSCLLITLLTLMFAGSVFPETTMAKRLSLLVIDANTYLVNQAVKDLDLPETIDVRFFTHQDLMDTPQAQQFVADSEIVIVDVMMRELSDYLIEHVDFTGKKIYAVRGSRDNEALTQKGFIFNPVIKEYYQHLLAENIQNMVYRVIHDEWDNAVDYQAVVKVPRLRMYHPDADTIFTRYEDYWKWYQQSGHMKAAPRIGLMFFSSSLMEGQMEQVNYLIHRLEKEDFNVVPGFGRDFAVLGTIMADQARHPRVDMILAFTLKFYNAINDDLKSMVSDLNIPIINAVNLYSSTIEEWKADPCGIQPMDVMWNIANSELTGIIEPTLLSGKKKIFDKDAGRHFFIHLPIKENIELLIPRIHKWMALKQKENKNKRVAILYYNHSQGKQNIGASYLNVFRSLEEILGRMRHEGYSVTTDNRLTEDGIKDLVLKYGRNIGSWAPGELDQLLREDKVIRLPIQTYQTWFNALPPDFKARVIKQWGKPEDSDIMVKDGDFIIPAILLGNVMIMPEPSRGWGDDPMKLYHDPTLYPHHQYIAAYLWLKHGFHADAMVHLGTHATHEWLPGKQTGLSHACPPEVLITDIPNLYPYIVDDVGEGIQAKRRGRGVIIDHMIPPLKESDLYHEYAELYDLISSYNQSITVDSKTTDPKLEKIREMTRTLGIDTDLDIQQFDEEALEEIEHYLLEVKTNFMPYGMHTFGKDMDGDGLEAMTTAILKKNPDIHPDDVKRDLSASAKREMDHLIKGLDGGFIPAGEGNDPVRNPSAVPTGKNFYGFDPDKIPSKVAWELGKSAAEQIIAKQLKEKQTYPEKVAVVLWATETIRNEGVNESTLLYLIGVRPVWDPAGRVKGVEVIPGRQLKRPRIDVLINPSGLYRDLFPNMLVFLDDAVQKAAVQDDIENLIRKHSADIKARLTASGMSEKEADTLSRIRIFTEQPGSYGTGVSEMTGASGFWESDAEIVDVYENRVGYAFGLGQWGTPAQEAFKSNLKGVSTTVHSISSNVYGTMDNDDVFQYLGGLTLAVKKESGQSPDTLISMQRDPDEIQVEDIAKTLGRELRSRYLNPKWIEGMQKENYAGATEMAKFVEYMWGWQVTVPDAVDKRKWEQTYDVYVEDKYGLEMKEFFNKQNPWAYQSVTARMLEAVRKNYWAPDEKVSRKLAVEYALNVVDKGVACCDHTCNNPLLNQMVVNIISLPGVMSPQMVEQFKMAIEQAMQKSLEEQVKTRKALQQELTQAPKKNAATTSQQQQNKADDSEKLSESGAKTDNHNAEIEGYKMEEIEQQDETTEMSSSGIQWFASLFIMLLVGLFAYGVKRN